MINVGSTTESDLSERVWHSRQFVRLNRILFHTVDSQLLLMLIITRSLTIPSSPRQYFNPPVMDRYALHCTDFRSSVWANDLQTLFKMGTNILGLIVVLLICSSAIDGQRNWAILEWRTDTQMCKYCLRGKCKAFFIMCTYYIGVNGISYILYTYVRTYMGVNDRFPNAQICRGSGTCSGKPSLALACTLICIQHQRNIDCKVEDKG